MADRKISDLTALTAPAAGDYLPIVDISEASAANKNKRITIEELLRGAPDGTAAAPSIGFESDPNTGIYSPGADALGLVTGGTERLRITSAGLAGIGTTSPSGLLNLSASNAAGYVSQVLDNTNATGYVNQVFRIGSAGASGQAEINYAPGTFFAIGPVANDTTTPIVFRNNNATERARIDSSGRLLVGTSTAQGDYTLQIQGDAVSASAAGCIYLRRGLNTAAIGGNIGADLGKIQFGANDGTVAARIECLSDAAWSSTSDCPGRLVFSTTADGAASPTERLRITSAGVLQVADASNISVGTTTGTKIGTATTQKLGFYNVTPVVQPTAVADATDAASVITQLNALLSRMRDLGLIAT